MLLDMYGICKDYMQGKMSVRVLTDVSLQVEEGDYLAIMGPSGSGKTTLMNLIGCLDVPTQGSYFLDGEEIGKLTPNKLAEIRNEILGFVFQSFYLLPKMSALDNVALPLLYAGVPKKERRARAQAALETMGLGDRLEFRPNQLSGGQCQRVAIARAIVTNPKILLADEPTGALDSASGAQIMDIFDELNESGVTIIMITHEQEVAARAKRICHIRDGFLSGGLPEYESEGTPRKVSLDHGMTMDMPEDPEALSEEDPTLPELEAEPADKEQYDRWIDDMIKEMESKSDEGTKLPSVESADTEAVSDPDALIESPTNDESETPEKEEALDTLATALGLQGHETDLFALAADVFDSPEREDVFASPDIGDVFSVNQGEEFTGHV